MLQSREKVLKRVQVKVEEMVGVYGIPDEYYNSPPLRGIPGWNVHIEWHISVRQSATGCVGALTTDV